MRLDVARFAEEWNVEGHDVWAVGRILREDVDSAFAHDEFMDHPWEPDWSYDEHVRRIAYLMCAGWSDPIEIDVGIPSLGLYPTWPIQDGNHRFVAALFGGMAWIRAIASGEVGEIRRVTWRAPRRKAIDPAHMREALAGGAP